MAMDNPNERDEQTTRSSRRSKMALNNHSNTIIFSSSILNQRNRTKFDFDHFLNTNIPDMFKIDVVNNGNGLPNKFQYHRNEELKDFNFKKLQDQLSKDFPIDLVDYKSKDMENGDQYKKRKRMLNAKKENRLPKKRGRPPLAKDQLINTLYQPIHDRLARDEKKFSDSEKASIKREIDDYIELLPILGVNLKFKSIYEELLGLRVEDLSISDELMGTLRSVLPQITVIKNPYDDDELLMKYRLTIREIKSLLVNYFKIKKLDELLKREYINYWNSMGVYDQEQKTPKDVKLLKRQRLEKRNQLIGPVHKIKFSRSGVQLNLDPISGPYLSKCKMKKNLK